MVLADSTEPTNSKRFRAKQCQIRSFYYRIPILQEFLESRVSSTKLEQGRLTSI